MPKPRSNHMLLLPRKTIYEGYAGLHFRHGKLVNVLPPGQHWFTGLGHEVIVVDKRPVTAVVGGQEVISLDGGALRISLVVVHQIDDPELHYRSGQIQATPGFLGRSPIAIATNDPRIHQLIQIGIREWVMAKTFRDAFESRASLTSSIQTDVVAAAVQFGVKIKSIQLLDFTPVGGLKAAMADLLKTDIEGQAALARARNESVTMRSLLNTARLVREHPGLLELRVLSNGQKPRVTFVVGDHSRTEGVPSTADEPKD